MAPLDRAQISLRRSFSVRLVFSPSNFPLLKKPCAASVGNVFWLDNPIRFKALNFVGRAGPNQTPVHSLSDGGRGSFDDDRRPPFDLNLAVVLAGFAFEAYTSPPENVGWREVDAADCQTVFLSEKFLHEIYDGQLFIKLRNRSSCDGSMGHKRSLCCFSIGWSNCKEQDKMGDKGARVE